MRRKPKVPNTSAGRLLFRILEDISGADFTVTDVCQEAGIDPSQVSRWKAGTIEPRMSNLDKLAEAFDRLSAAHELEKRLGSPG